jgi:hypothetical protein
MTRILQGYFVAFFAFDIGYEVSVERLADLFAATPIQPLSRKRQTPAYLQFTKPPVTLDLKTNEQLRGLPGKLQATIFDFGALSMAYRWPLSCDSGLPLDQLASLGADIYRREIEAIARGEVNALLKKIAPAVERPKLSGLTEDYYLYVLEELEPTLSAKRLLTDHRCELAQALTFETSPLSDWQVEETMSQIVSYLEDDLAVVDWNAAVIYDRDHEDTVRVLELLNVELLEARYIDATLDKNVTTYATLLQKPAKWPIPLRTPYQRALQELTEWRIESTVLSERVTNALKLVGDLYLSRIHSAGAMKVHLPDWEKIIAEKLQILDELYERVDDRVRTAQNQTLELIIVTLIVLELLLALFRHG